MQNYFQILSKVGIPGLDGISIDIPDPGGIFSGGVISGIGTILQILLGLSMAYFVVMVIYAAYLIIKSQGEPDKIKEGMTRIKYMWFSAGILFVFFIGITLVGVFMGFGNPMQWGNTLAQCGGYDGPFYFGQVDQETKFYEYNLNIDVPANNKAYCCKYDSATNNHTVPLRNDPFSKTFLISPSNQSNIVNFGIKDEDKYAWVLMDDPTNPKPPASAGFSDCYLFGK